MRTPVLLATVALLGCSGGDDSGGPAGNPTGGTCDADGPTATYVMRSLYFARSEEGVGWGFDLDGHASAAGDPEGCGKADLTDPEGQGGIDNAFAGLLPTLEQTEAVAVEGLLQDAISSGDLLLMVDVRGLDDRQNDDCVTVGFGPAVGSPLVGNDGLLLDGQSFQPDAGEDQVVVADARVEDGTLIVEGIEFTLELQVLTAALAIDVSDGALRIDLPEDAEGEEVATGFFGGGFSTEYMLDTLNEEAIDSGLKEILNTVIPLTADLKDADGVCNHMSVTFEYEAIPAFYYEEE